METKTTRVCKGGRLQATMVIKDFTNTFNKGKLNLILWLGIPNTKKLIETGPITVEVNPAHAGSVSTDLTITKNGPVRIQPEINFCDG